MRGLNSDNELRIMTEISKKDNLSQREISKNLDLSVSTINVLIKKMISEGLIKMSQVSTNQVLYMLTPEGFKKKAEKTLTYIRNHYLIIDENKKKIQILINSIKEDKRYIYVLINDAVINEIVHAAVSDIGFRDISFINNVSEINQNSSTLLYLSEDNIDLSEVRKLRNVEFVDFLDSL